LILFSVGQIILCFIDAVISSSFAPVHIGAVLCQIVRTLVIPIPFYITVFVGRKLFMYYQMKREYDQPVEEFKAKGHQMSLHGWVTNDGIPASEKLVEAHAPACVNDKVT
jgi:hypothetical protein